MRFIQESITWFKFAWICPPPAYFSLTFQVERHLQQLNLGDLAWKQWALCSFPSKANNEDSNPSTLSQRWTIRVSGDSWWVRELEEQPFGNTWAMAQVNTKRRDLRAYRTWATPTEVYANVQWIFGTGQSKNSLVHQLPFKNKCQVSLL